ncbi:triphosphoribosyl-dephospho-CoA synthase CitG [Geosporobacter ferrireducens]|uniref:Probable 2-(5''-triphosphoribosyl)-3'-dephosphocoenzyme-A synthase n=2 Tax=Geosporobacter ferrireducens TaxID=1424294 RepID=A0A1D8GQA6_9FIRM|nr:triphosphoribosyl-dephospho-CoA synthase CitG [Geosporobacter ferrireducens]
MKEDVFVGMNDFCLTVAETAIKSMLYEVSATPKPGLVDRRNSGAHKDMNFLTFMSSSAVLFDTFYRCAIEGMNFTTQDYPVLLERIRPFGIEGEKKMFAATNGVNTHKGLVFSLGIIAAALGSLYKEKKESIADAQEICKRVQEIAVDLCKELGMRTEKRAQTYGEKLYERYNIKGIRGEVASGFKTVLKYGLPVMKKYTSCDEDLNNVFVQVLLHLMSETEDSNILGRHDHGTLEYVKQSAEIALQLGGVFTKEGMEYIIFLDREFISRNISPGGSADLLAVTIMLYLLEQQFECNEIKHYEKV